MTRLALLPSLALLLTLALGLAGCGGPYTPSIRLALDGPPLSIAMQGETLSWYGQMDRSCMAGVGDILLLNANGTTCKGEMDRPANDKGRLYADLTCDNGDTLTLVFRNLGPDQGMGLGRINPDAADGEQTTLFYHPSQNEAQRRLGEVREEIAAMLEKKRKDGIVAPALSAE